MKFVKTFILPLLFITICGWLLHSAYMEVKNRTVEQLNNKQFIIAETAAKGIESFFDHYNEVLSQLSEMKGIASFDEDGKELMQDLYLTHSSEIKGLSRVDAAGRIIHTCPETPGAVGTDLSSQEHVQKILQTHEPVLSDVFESVQGFQTIAYHVPVFEGGRFRGSLGILIPFDQLSRKYLQPIRIGREGYAWMISQKGIELYCPVTGHTGKSVFENCKDFPTLLAMAQEMVKGKQGATSYFYDRVRDEMSVPVQKQAVFVPVHIGDTFWSIAVATPEEKVLEIIQGFKNRWLLITALIICIAVLWNSYLLRAFKILKEEEKRRQAERALKASEEKYRELVENANSIILRMDAEGRVTFFNRFAERFFGFLENEIVGRHIVGTIVPPAESSGRDLAVLLEQVVQNPEAYANNENENMRRNGERVWIAWTNKPILDENGRIAEVLCVGNDITDRKHARQMLQESEALLAESQEIAHLGSWSLDVGTGRLTWSDEVYRIFGFEPQEFPATYEDFLDSVHPDDRQAVDAAYSTSIRRGQSSYEIEHRIVRKRTGEVRHVQEKCIHVRDGSGKIVRSVGMVQDITERKHAEEALRASEENYRNLFENAPLGVFRTNSGGKVLSANSAMARILGLNSPQEALEHYRSLSDQLYVHAERRDEFIRLLRENGHVENFEYEARTADGRHIWLNMNARMESHREDGSLVIEGFTTDITERKRAEEERESLQAQLNQAQKMESVGRLAGGVAHDFNNMLGVIIGHTELAMNGTDSAQPAYSDLQQILRASHRSANLVRQLLAFARKQTVSPRVLQINETVESMLKMVRRLIGEDIELLWKPCLNDWPVKVDPTQIDQILANLCVNARDAIAGVGKVTIESHNVSFDEAYCRANPEASPGEYVVLAVSDDGCGMESEVLDRLFEPFFTTKEAGKGTGLGLATVYGIVKQNNGFIDVQSEPGRGTSFRIYLPRVSAPAAGEEPSQEQKKNPTGMERILLVEDEQSILQLTQRILEHHGYRVMAAPSPMEALDLAERHAGRIDLLITDVIMPEMNGRELMERISAVKPGFKCIFMSGYTGDILAKHSIVDKGVHFLQKPFSVKSLTEKVRQVLDDA